MKKNLRIVSAAAAALLAVAPVAAAAVAPASTVQAANEIKGLDLVDSASLTNPVKSSDVKSAAENTVKNADLKSAITGLASGNSVVSAEFAAGASFSAENPVILGNRATTTVNANGFITVKLANALDSTHNSFSFNGHVYSTGAVDESHIITINSSEHIYQIAAPKKWTVKAVVENSNGGDTTTPSTNIDSNLSNNDFNWGVGEVSSDTDVNVKPNLVLNAANKNAGITKSTLTGTITATIGGKNYTALYNPNGADPTTVVVRNHGSHAVVENGAQLTPGVKYDVEISSLKFNFGTENANKKFTLVLPSDASATYDNQTGRKLKVQASSAGVVTLKNVKLVLTAKDLSDASNVYFVDRTLGNVVTSGAVTLNANANGEINEATVVAAAEKAYTAFQVNRDNGKLEGVVSLSNDIADALKKANITPDANGFFKAPHTLTFNLSAKSSVNDATAKLPVTVTFANVAESNTNTDASKAVSKTIMHIAAIYDKDGKQLNLAKLRAYDSVSVLPEAETIKGSKMYQVVENGKATGHYVKASNIDGTSKTLKHNSYVYTQYGKKVYKKNGKAVKLTKKVKRSTLRKEASGKTLTVYGGALFNKQYYRIGKNQYIKVANFR